MPQIITECLLVWCKQ